MLKDIKSKAEELNEKAEAAMIKAVEEVLIKLNYDTSNMSDEEVIDLSKKQELCICFFDKKGK